MSSPAGAGETPERRDARNVAELIQELRVAGLGVQVLFGFLLGLPFTTRFDRLEPWQRWLYLAVLLLAATSIILLVAPVAYHRLVFRQHQREHLVRFANSMAIAGLVAVSLAISCAVLLAMSYVMPGVATVVGTAVVGCMFGVLWFALPLLRRERARGDLPPAAGASPGESAGQGR
jgi:predicted membrane channel-forming protein YqfA (hemolysin III family)